MFVLCDVCVCVWVSVCVSNNRCTVQLCCCYVFAVCSIELLWHQTIKEDSFGIMVASHVPEISQIVGGSPVASPVSSPEASPRSGCSLSRKVPTAKTTGNHIRDMQLEFERNKIIDCIDILWDKPNVRAECLAFLQTSKTQEEQDDMGPDYFQGHYTPWKVA